LKASTSRASSQPRRRWRQSALMILFGVVYSPAGATMLIISFGIITCPVHLPAIEAASDQWSGQPTPPAAGS